jgi:hypothetical protein
VFAVTVIDEWPLENKERMILKKNIRESNEKYVTGDKVYYKKPDGNEWKGPGTVIGVEWGSSICQAWGFICKITICIFVP